MRAAIYARVSSAAQRESHTIENQLRTLPSFVEQQGWTLVDTYIDDGRSAKTGKLEKREGFARLVRDAAAKKFDVLVVVDIDRLTRTSDAIERASIFGPFQRAGIDIVTPSGGRLDLDSFIGGLYVELQARFAAEENRKRAERIVAGKARAIAEGRKPAGPTPYGLAYSRATGTWAIDSKRGSIVREIYARVIGGEACAAIADDLQARGEPPPRTQWLRSKVWQIARARYPVGEWTANKAQRATMKVPALIDEATWQLAQAKLVEHGLRGLVKTKHVYLLEGLGTCGTCGEPMAIRSATLQRHRGHITPAAYVCRARKIQQRGAGRCTAPIVAVADVDARVWEKVSGALVSPLLAAAVQRKAEARAANVRDWQADVERYVRQLAQRDRTSAGITARYRRGLLTDDVYDGELAAAQKERAFIEAQLKHARDAVRAPGAPVVSPERWLSMLAELAEQGTPVARQRIVRKLVEGRVLFVGHDVELTLAIDQPASSAAASRGEPEIRIVSVRGSD